MFSGQTSFSALFSPDDDVREMLVRIIDSAKHSIHFMVYGANDTTFFDAIVRAHQRGCDVKGIFDHTQSCGAGQAKQLDSLFSLIPQENFLIGTSRKHQIFHTKAIWTELPDVLTDIPDAPLYESVDEAMSQGMPVTGNGSYNFTTKANDQCNSFFVMPGFGVANEMEKIFRANWAWIAANEARYQVRTA